MEHQRLVVLFFTGNQITIRIDESSSCNEKWWTERLEKISEALIDNKASSMDLYGRSRQVIHFVPGVFLSWMIADAAKTHNCEVTEYQKRMAAVMERMANAAEREVKNSDGDAPWRDSLKDDDDEETN